MISNYTTGFVKIDPKGTRMKFILYSHIKLGCTIHKHKLFGYEWPGFPTMTDVPQGCTTARCYP